jgi:hypothetical protein
LVETLGVLADQLLCFHLRDASDLLKLSLSETMDLLLEMGVKGNIRAADVHASLATFASLD